MSPEKQGFLDSNQGIMASVPPSFSTNWHALRSDRFDPVSLWERLGEDQELLGELVEIFAQEGPSLLELIRAAIGENDADGLSKAAHRLKGSVLQFSAVQATTQAADLEMMGRGKSLAGAGELFQKLEVEVGWLIKTLKTMVETSQQ